MSWELCKNRDSFTKSQCEVTVSTEVRQRKVKRRVLVFRLGPAVSRVLGVSEDDCGVRLYKGTGEHEGRFRIEKGSDHLTVRKRPTNKKMLYLRSSEDVKEALHQQDCSYEFDEQGALIIQLPAAYVRAVGVALIAPKEAAE